MGYFFKIYPFLFLLTFLKTFYEFSFLGLHKID